MHLLVDSTGLKLCDAGEWLVEKHGTKTRRAWRKLHIGLDADTGQIVAAVLTTKEVDDGAEVGPLLDQVAARGEMDLARPRSWRPVRDRRVRDGLEERQRLDAPEP